MAGEDRSYLEWIRTLPCSRCTALAPSEAHHKTGHGVALKAHDYEAMPLCTLCHEQIHKLSGHFKGWTREQLAKWQVEQIAKTRARSKLNTDPDVF